MSKIVQHLLGERLDGLNVPREGPMRKPHETMTVSEAMRALGVARQTVYNRMYTGVLKSRKVAGRPRPLRSAVEAMAAQAQDAEQSAAA